MAAAAKIRSTGARVQTSVHLVSLAELAEGDDTLDFDALLRSWMYYPDAVRALMLTV